MASEADCGALVAATVECFGRPHILVDKAAIYPRATLLETTIDVCRASMATKLAVPLVPCREAVSHMITRGRCDHPCRLRQRQGRGGKPDPLCAVSSPRAPTSSPIARGRICAGPQAAGFLTGRADLIASVALQHQDFAANDGTWDTSAPLLSPGYGPGRPMKIGREEIVGALVALTL